MGVKNSVIAFTIIFVFALVVNERSLHEAFNSGFWMTLVLNCIYYFDDWVRKGKETQEG